MTDTATSRAAPRWAYGAAVLASFLLMAVLFLAILSVEAAGSHPRLLVFAAVALLGLSLAYRWPLRSWRWGMLASCAFWLYFGFVWFSYLWNGQFRWAPAVDAAGVLIVACLAAEVGSRLASRRRALALERAETTGGRAGRGTS